MPVGLNAVAKAMEPLFRHSSNAAIINGGTKTNVIPSAVLVYLECWASPGHRCPRLAPMNLPAYFDFLKTIRAANNLLPALDLEFGTEAMHRLLLWFHE